MTCITLYFPGTGKLLLLKHLPVITAAPLLRLLLLLHAAD